MILVITSSLSKNSRTSGSCRRDGWAATLCRYLQTIQTNSWPVNITWKKTKIKCVGEAAFYVYVKLSMSLPLQCWSSLLHKLSRGWILLPHFHFSHSWDTTSNHKHTQTPPTLTSMRSSLIKLAVSSFHKDRWQRKLRRWPWLDQTENKILYPLRSSEVGEGLCSLSGNALQTASHKVQENHWNAGALRMSYYETWAVSSGNRAKVTHERA